MKRILMISTGGTIASVTGNNGLTPHLSSHELLECVPELKDICDIDVIELFKLDSTNIGPYHWVKMTETIRDHYQDYDGFVITHGTDTMAYSAAALSYMIQNTDKPIVLTGSQKSIYNRDTDARNNMIRSFIYASDDQSWGVHIVFDNKVILGTRAKKDRSKSFNAFRSINYPETASFIDYKLVHFIHRPAGTEPVRFYTELNPNIFVLKLVPGMSGEIFRYICGHYKGLIIEGFGSGGLPNTDDSLLEGLKQFLAEDGIAVFSTQVENEGSDLSVYEVGRIAQSLPGVVEGKDMTAEAIITKLMWALGQTDDVEICKQLFIRPIQFDRLVL